MLNHYNNELSLQNINPNPGISVQVYSPNRAARPTSGRQSSKRKKSKTGRISRSRTPGDCEVTKKPHNPADSAPQNNIHVVKTFLNNLKRKEKPSRQLGSRKNSQSQKRSRSKSRAKTGHGMHSLTFDIRERENYNKKLDETVQRILDREKEYLEEQLLREKRENKAKDAMVCALKSDLAQLQQNISGVNKSGIS